MTQPNNPGSAAKTKVKITRLRRWEVLCCCVVPLASVVLSARQCPISAPVAKRPRTPRVCAPRKPRPNSAAAARPSIPAPCPRFSHRHPSPFCRRRNDRPHSDPLALRRHRSARPGRACPVPDLQFRGGGANSQGGVNTSTQKSRSASGMTPSRSRSLWSIRCSSPCASPSSLWRHATDEESAASTGTHATRGSTSAPTLSAVFEGTHCNCDSDNPHALKAIPLTFPILFFELLEEGGGVSEGVVRQIRANEH